MRVSAPLPRGVSALFAESARRRRALESALVERLEAAGFAEAVLPVVDYLEPYESLLTPASRRELYQFVGRDGELLALRSDFTPMLARLVAPRLDALELPLRVFYRGDVVRFEEERPGRLRELYQLGAELLGEPGEAAEERMLRLFLDLLALGHDQPVDVVLGFAGALDHVWKGVSGPAADRRRLAEALLRRDRVALRRAGADALLAVAERGVPDEAAALGPAAERLDALVTLAGRLSAERPRVRVAVDLAEFATLTLDEPAAAGLGGEAADGGSSGEAADGGSSGEAADAALGGRSYYDGLVFRAYLGTGALPVGGGGRYDRLFRALGAEVPAVGFSLGLDRLERAVSPPDPVPGGGAP